MTNANLGIVFLGILGLGGACGSGGSNGGSEMTATGCTTPGASGCKVFVQDASFVRWAGPVTDAAAGGASSAVVRHTPHTFCLSGIADAGPTGTGWGAILHLGLSDVDETGGAAHVVAPFDASALGIKQVQFTIESPPSAGVLPQVTQMQSADCKMIPGCIMTFSLAAGVTKPGEVATPLAAFRRADADHPGTTLNQTLITGLQFYVPALPGPSTPYDFCLRDLAFLGPGSNEVTP